MMCTKRLGHCMAYLKCAMMVPSVIFLQLSGAYVCMHVISMSLWLTSIKFIPRLVKCNSLFLMATKYPLII